MVPSGPCSCGYNVSGRTITYLGRKAAFVAGGIVGRCREVVNGSVFEGPKPCSSWYCLR